MDNEKAKSFELVKAALEHELNQINPLDGAFGPDDLDSLFVNMTECLSLLQSNGEKQEAMLSAQRKSIEQELPGAIAKYKDRLSRAATPEEKEKIVTEVKTRLLRVIKSLSH